MSWNTVETSTVLVLGLSQWVGDLVSGAVVPTVGLQS